MKKFFKILGSVILLIVVGGVISYFVYNEKLPTGEKGKNADALAIKMMNALNADAFDSTEVLEWSFRNTNHYKWFKSENIVEVSWDKNKVILHTKNTEKSEVFLDEKKVENEELIQTATDFFNNDLKFRTKQTLTNSLIFKVMRLC